MTLGIDASQALARACLYPPLDTLRGRTDLVAEIDAGRLGSVARILIGDACDAAGIDPDVIFDDPSLGG